MANTVSQSFIRQLKGHKLVTAHILYHLPDFNHILQEYIWQEYDAYPKLPQLKAFLAFWNTNIEGKLHSVRVMHTGLIKPAEIRLARAQLHLH